jgi:monovalent cation:H+ antiporter, CPA1 family
MLTAGTTLAVFTMFGISSLAVFWAKKLHLPHTVLLVLIGMVLGLATYIPAFHFFSEFQLTPGLLFYLLLPTLIFESAYNMSVRRLVEDMPIVLVLSIISLLVSTLAIAGALYFILAFIGYPVPFIITLLFGALISATDPVAVLSLFKEVGAPPRLSLIFEGESLFNDATAVALFLVVLGIVLDGYHGFGTILEGTITFTSMMVGGVIFGVIMGGIFSRLVGQARENELVSITLTIVLAHITFILAEEISHYLVFGGLELPLSPIIATTVAALLMGNYGRAKINPNAEEFIEKLWGQLAFLANSLIFILIGILFVNVPNIDQNMLGIILITVLVVAISRAISIYPVVSVFNIFVKKSEDKINTAWQHLLSWGSLRGALAVTMVLLVPDSLNLPGWTLSMTPKEFLLSLTVGCIFATIFIKATTIQALMKKLKLDRLTEIEAIEYQEARALMHHEVTEKLARYVERGYIESDVAESILHNHERAYNEACQEINNLSDEAKNNLAERVLRMYGIGIEKRHLKDLYSNNELNELVYRRLSGKLRLQFEAIEKGDLDPNMSLHTDGKDVFEIMANALKNLFNPTTEVELVQNNYLYYRAQTIISRKVLKELNQLSEDNAKNIFTPNALSHVKSVYENFMNQSEKKRVEISNSKPVIINELARMLASRGVHKIEENVIAEIRERELITAKLHITLSEEVNARGESLF